MDCFCSRNESILSLLYLFGGNYISYVCIDFDSNIRKLTV
jgi:hypothetical protein